MLQRIKAIVSSLGRINENPKVLKIRGSLSAPVGALLIKARIHPTVLNIIGLATGLLSAICIAEGYFALASTSYLVSALADGLDGVVARALKIDNSFGSFFDSVCDRYVDTAILLGIAWYYMNVSIPLNVLLAFIALIGTVVTSYARARAESLSISSRYIGFLSRPERNILILVGLSLSQLLVIVLWVLAILANLTAIHRIMFYSVAAHKIDKQNKQDITG